MGLFNRYRCKVLSKIWLSPSVFQISFRPDRTFKFVPGQFVSVELPSGEKRVYSLAAPHEMGYQLCIKRTNGLGPAYLANLQEGDTFNISGPYGHFGLAPSEPKTSVCLISTGSGIAPLRSILLSEHFQQQDFRDVYFIQGAKTQSDILYPEDLKRFSEPVFALSKEESNALESRLVRSFRGRVTDYLRSLSQHWPWHAMRFYVCGNGQMVEDVTQILQNEKGVSEACIQREHFSSPRKSA